MLQKVNLRRLVLEMGKSKMTKLGKGGNRTSNVPALEKQKHVEPDSSDEELERLLDEGAAGR